MSRARICLVAVGVTVVALSAAGAAMPRAAAEPPTLVVVVLGSGRVTSQPAGISCPGRCRATFAAGTRAVLTPSPRNGSRFLRWGGSCTGTRACRVGVSSLSAVAAQFAAGPTPPTRRFVVEPGSYFGANPQNGNPIRFFVAAGSARVLNISIPVVSLACTPPGRLPDRDRFGILRAAIRANGSFTAKASQSGVFADTKAKFTYSFSGRFQKATAGRAATAAGSFRMDVVFTDSTTHRCTSNNQSWTATRTGDPQPPRRRVVEPGSYFGASPQNGNPITFSVAAGGSAVVNISIPFVSLACTPPGRLPDRDHLGIARAAIKSDGSFTAKASQDGVFAGVNAKFTYSFTGYFQGVTSYGDATASGIFREDIVFTDSTTRTCTSNEQSWTVTRTR